MCRHRGAAVAPALAAPAMAAVFVGARFRGGARRRSGVCGEAPLAWIWKARRFGHRRGSNRGFGCVFWLKIECWATLPLCFAGLVGAGRPCLRGSALAGCGGPGVAAILCGCHLHAQFGLLCHQGTEYFGAGGLRFLPCLPWGLSPHSGEWLKGGCDWRKGGGKRGRRENAIFFLFQCKLLFFWPWRCGA